MFSLFLSVLHEVRFRMCSTLSIDPKVYPSARKDETVQDDFHGTKVSDPYRWMEDPDAQETKEFVDKLNAISRPFLSASDCRDKLSARLTDLWDYEKFTCTSKRGKHYYYRYNSGLQNQYVLFQQKALGEKGTVFLDPNTLSEDGTTATRGSSFSEDGTLYAYGLSEKGSDWVTLKFKTEDGVDLPDVIPGAKFTDIAWTIDNKGVFYSKYPMHKSATEGTAVEKHEFHSLFYHRMGTPASEDLLVFQMSENPDYMLTADVTEDGRFLIIDISRGCDPFNMIYYYDLEAVNNVLTGPIKAVPIFGKLEAKYSYVDHDDKHMYFITNNDAPMFKLIRIEIAKGAESAETIIDENPRACLEWAASIVGGRLVVCYIEDVKAAMYVHELVTGRRLYQIPLEIGTISGFFGNKHTNECFFSFESFLTPMIEYRLDFAGKALDEMPPLEEQRRVEPKGLKKEDFSVEQVFYPSKDGTKIPMYILSSKDMEKNGENPTVLYGYGGFNIAEQPVFSITRLLFAKHFGGIFATANLRGGSEYGENWHRGGMKENKQNVFDDFIAAAEYLIREKYTQSSKLAIQGGSNGGLLVAACSQQRPELFECVINRVGVLDMLRFHKFTIGGAWVPEFGCPDVKEEFEHIYKYSPLHNLRIPPDGQWPATLIMTADHDDRVVPSHSLKYIATLYEKAKQHGKQTKPILARVEVKAGHGSGKPTSKVIEENVDLYAFVQRVLRANYRD